VKKEITKMSLVLNDAVDDYDDEYDYGGLGVANGN